MLFAPTTPSAGGIEGVDKLVHVLLFAALAAASRARYGAGLGWVLAYALGSEVLQTLLPIPREGSAADALADAIGALLGWAALRRTAGLRDRGKEPGAA